MAIYDNDGTVNFEINKIYDNDSLSNHQIGKVYENNTTTDYLIYTAEKVLLGGGTNLLGTPAYNWTEGPGYASVSDFTLQTDGSYLMRMGVGDNGWRNWYFNFPNIITTDGHTTLKLTYTVTNNANLSSVSVYTGNGTYDRLDTTLNKEQVFTKDISDRDKLQVFFGGAFSAGGKFYAKIRITLE